MSSFEPIPADVKRVADLMAEFPAPWALCGGWAVDAWLGRQTRKHQDVDIAIFETDQQALRPQLKGWQLVAHDDNWEGTNPVFPNVPIPDSELWNGRVIEIPGHLHCRAEDQFEFEVNLNERDGAEWVFRREPRISLPIEQCIYTCGWGIRAVTPVVALFFKALMPVWRDEERKPPRYRDEHDFGQLLPHLSPEQKEWLGSSVALVEPEHPWLARLRSE